MIVTEEVDLNNLPELTDEQKRMLIALKNRIPVPDKDCPELSPSELHKMTEDRKRKQFRTNKYRRK